MDDKSIWNEAQNKPTLIARDLAPYVEADIVYESLLRRGVFKWLAVRRNLIVLKNTWKARVTASLERQKAAKDTFDFHTVDYERGYRKGIEECRAEVRALCHSERWQAPDHDRHAIRWLERRRLNKSMPK